MAEKLVEKKLNSPESPEFYVYLQLLRDIITLDLSLPFLILCHFLESGEVQQLFWSFHRNFRIIRHTLPRKSVYHRSRRRLVVRDRILRWLLPGLAPIRARHRRELSWARRKIYQNSTGPVAASAEFRFYPIKYPSWHGCSEHRPFSFFTEI